jgi:hypothetical protein
VTGLAACQDSTAPQQLDVGAATLPPIAKDYRAQIVDWARGFYRDPRTLQGTQISDPILIRDETGRLLWQVCIVADARGPDGRYMGPQRQAFGFAPNYFSAPLQRNNSTLIRENCDRPLTWRPFPELSGAGRAALYGRRPGHR